MLTELERQDRQYGGPYWWARLVILKNSIKFLLQHEQVIQIGMQVTDQHYTALIRYAGLSARDVEEVLKDFSEQVDHERANMNQVHRILNKRGR